jgi:hypothetical protein
MIKQFQIDPAGVAYRFTPSQAVKVAQKAAQSQVGINSIAHPIGN